MRENPTRRTVLKTSLAAAAAAAAPASLAADVTTKELSGGFATPLTTANQKLVDLALKDVKDATAARLKHKLAENTEPSMVFQVRPGATQKW